MKLTDFIADVGRPVAFYPGLRKITDSINATLFICQLIYWKGKEANEDGWIYKTSDEIEAETGLTYREQKTARDKLIKKDFLEERYARLEHRLYFRVKYDKINTAWAIAESVIPETTDRQLGNIQSVDSTNNPSVDSYNIDYQRTQPKNTPLKKGGKKQEQKNVESLPTESHKPKKRSIPLIEHSKMLKFANYYPELSNRIKETPAEEPVWLLYQVIHRRWSDKIGGKPFYKAAIAAAEYLKTTEWYEQNGGLLWLLDVGNNGYKAAVNIAKYMKSTEQPVLRIRDGMLA